MVSLSFFFLLITLESLNAYASLKASHTLVWGHWWRTVGVYIAPVVALVLMFFVIGVLTALGGSNQYVAQAISSFLAAIAGSFFLVLGYVQYNDLKLRKFGGNPVLER
jgi:hypothetical protein